MIWFEIPIELSRSELPDVTIRVRWRSSRLGSLSCISACIHRRKPNLVVIGSHRGCPPADWSLKQRNKSGACRTLHAAISLGLFGSSR